MESIEHQSLEDLIKNDASGVQIMTIIDELKSVAGSLKVTLNKGLPLDEATLCQKEIKALSTAHKVLEKIWSEQHT